MHYGELRKGMRVELTGDTGTVVPRGEDDYAIIWDDGSGNGQLISPEWIHLSELEPLIGDWWDMP